MPPHVCAPTRLLNAAICNKCPIDCMPQTHRWQRRDSARRGCEWRTCSFATSRPTEAQRRYDRWQGPHAKRSPCTSAQARANSLLHPTRHRPFPLPAHRPPPLRPILHPRPLPGRAQNLCFRRRKEGRSERARETPRRCCTRLSRRWSIHALFLLC